MNEAREARGSRRTFKPIIRVGQASGTNGRCAYRYPKSPKHEPRDRGVGDGTNVDMTDGRRRDVAGAQPERVRGQECVHRPVRRTHGAERPAGVLQTIGHGFLERERGGEAAAEGGIHEDGGASPRLEHVLLVVQHGEEA